MMEADDVGGEDRNSPVIRAKECRCGAGRVLVGGGSSVVASVFVVSTVAVVVFVVVVVC